MQPGSEEWSADVNQYLLDAFIVGAVKHGVTLVESPVRNKVDDGWSRFAGPFDRGDSAVKPVLADAYTALWLMGDLSVWLSRQAGATITFNEPPRVFTKTNADGDISPNRAIWLLRAKLERRHLDQEFPVGTFL